MIELVGFVTGLLGAVPRLVTSWVETRNAIRVEYTRAHLSSASEAERIQTALRIQEIEAATQAAVDYPLGVPGRLRSLLRPSDLPTILVSPPPPGYWEFTAGVADRIRELVTGVETVGDYARLPSGAFAGQPGSTRFIAGEVGARMVATAEFGREPAIIVYFEAGPRTLTAHAYLSTIFGSVGGDTEFSFTIARYSHGGSAGHPAVSSRNGDLPSWHHIDLAGAHDTEPAEVIAVTVTWFLLAAVDAYWRIRSGAAPGLLARTTSGIPVQVPQPAPGTRPAPAARRTPTRQQPPAAQPAPADAGADTASFLRRAPEQRTRLEEEARQLVGTGYDVTAEELDGGFVGLHVRGGQDVIFVVDHAYPLSPPALIWVDGSEIELDAEDWSPEFTLADIVEAVR